MREEKFPAWIRSSPFQACRCPYANPLLSPVRRSSIVDKPLENFQGLALFIPAQVFALSGYRFASSIYLRKKLTISGEVLDA